MGKIVKVLKSKIKNGIKKLLVEVLKDDPQWHSSFTLPGIESAPIPGEKVFLQATDKNGKMVSFGVPLKTDIDDGELRLNGRTDKGIVKCSLFLKKDGTVELGFSNLKKVVNEDFMLTYNNHTHVVDLSSLLAQITPSQMLPNHLTKEVKLG